MHVALVPLPKKGVKLLPWVEKLNNLFTVKGGKFKFSAQENNLAPFVGNGTKVKILSEIRPNLVKTQAYKFIIQLHKNVYPKPNVKISMLQPNITNCMWSWWLSLPDDLPKHKRKAIVIRLLNIKDWIADRNLIQWNLGIVNWFLALSFFY